MTAGQFFQKVLFKLRGVMTLRPRSEKRGHVLISHDASAMFMPEEKLGGHAHYWVTNFMVRSFLKRGYEVDIISWQNHTFKPRKKYNFFIDIHSNIERLAPLLDKDCIKIFHATGAHWLYQNSAEYMRCLGVLKRRGKTIFPLRNMTPTRSIENADQVIYFGSEFVRSTYLYAGKPMHATPIPSTHHYPSPEQKNFEAVRKHFVWFAGAGAVHKGLDLVLEAFASMPDYHLTIGGKWYEKDFADAYQHELNECSNITVHRYLDPDGDVFKKIAEESIATVFPSCSEGTAGSVIDCMQAGLIPIVSYEAGAHTGTYGVTLKENTIEAIRTAVREVSALPVETLKKNAVAAWNYARTTHTPEAFATAFNTFIDSLEAKRR
jgi:glycosyltransferase involved in cell wall biosynthesis